MPSAATKHLAGELRDVLADEAHAITHGELIGRPPPVRVLGVARQGAESGIGWGWGTPAQAEEAPEPEHPAKDAPPHKPAKQEQVDTTHSASPFLQHRLGDGPESCAVRVIGRYPRPAIIACQQKRALSYEVQTRVTHKIYEDRENVLRYPPVPV